MPNHGATHTGKHAPLPATVLFACTMNAVRSVMAAGILAHLAGPVIRIDSAGVHAGVFDPLVKEVMDEIGISIPNHKPKAFEDIRNPEFDLIVTLSPEAHHKALRFTRDTPTQIEYWPTMDATNAVGQGEDERLRTGYRQVRDQLFTRIKSHFSLQGGPTV